MKIEFIVHVPTYTAGSEPVYISGSIPEFGDWDPGRIKLDQSEPLVYRRTFEIAPGTQAEFKFTRGNWQTVEKTNSGEEISNRLYTVQTDTAVYWRVDHWSDHFKTERKHTLTGNIRFHEKFHSKILNNERTLAVYLPPSYDRKPEMKYPVLYLHDGQNVFDAATSFIGKEWELDETLEKLIRTKQIEEVIAVGIYNNDNRMGEYTPYRDSERGGGNGDTYLGFVVNEVKPFIDSAYRTLPDSRHTAIMGSSLGGLISLYAVCKYQTVFSMSGAVSPALYWSNRKIFDDVSNAKQLNAKIYMDMGTNEGTSTGPLKNFNTALEDARSMRDLLVRKKYVLGKDLEYFEDKGAIHNETHWARRARKPLIFFFGKKSDK